MSTEADTAASGRTRDARHSRFAVLRIRNFRLFVAGQLTSVTGTWMMVGAQDWLVLELSGNSAVALALITVCQFGPALVVPIGAGVLADRFAKRTVLIVANCSAAVLTAIQTLVVVGGHIELWHLYAIAAGIGVVAAVETPVRMAFITEIVGAERFRDASALSAMYFGLAQLCGPALSGVLIGTLGTGAAMGVNAVSYLATVATLLRVRPGELYRADRSPGRSDPLRGLRRVRGDLELRHTVLLVLLVGFFALTLRVTTPLLARGELDSDPIEFGILAAATAVGSLVAAVLAGARGTPSVRRAAVVAMILGGGEIALAPVTAPWLAVLVLAVCGAMITLFLQTVNHHLQLGAGPGNRVHVIAVYTMIVQGITPLAAIAVGVAAERYGVRAVVAAGGAATLGGACAILLRHRVLGARIAGNG
ncbi:MFS transporter [Nocardia sp. NPDC057227]|uniref:MFS transporter n=1 Tax=Nocardia sp. NPDC057227 TaxID=3346056 RepID=UPI003630C468